MKKVLIVSLLWLGLSYLTFANEVSNEGESMTAKGTFDVDLQPQDDADTPAGRMVIDKTYSGDITGSGKGQMISKRTEGGTAVYYAVEEFLGSVEGKNGAFTLIHKGHMSKESQTLDVEILEGSGSGELENISGSMAISQDSNGHAYELMYEL